MTKLPQSTSPFAGAKPQAVEFTIGDQSSNDINVAMQLKDDGKNVDHPLSVIVFVTSDAAGKVPAATPPSGAVAVGTNGTLEGAIIAKTAQRFLTDAQGRLDINITEAGAKSFYVSVMTPAGNLHVSGPVTFA